MSKVGNDLRAYAPPVSTMRRTEQPFRRHSEGTIMGFSISRTLRSLSYSARRQEASPVRASRASFRPILVAALVGGFLIAPAASATAAPAPERLASFSSVASKADKAQQQADLIAFNGYYVLSATPSSFFYINTTMTAPKGDSRRSYSIGLEASLDGTTAYSAVFDGTFTGNRLVQKVGTGPGFDLRFTRLGTTTGPTATITGTVTLPGQSPVSVTGTTYSNPIAADSWGGQTYYAAAAPGGSPTPAVRITKDGEILYKDTPSSKWTRAASYTYNLDMYYFALPDRDMIMGTGGQSGKVMNEMKTVAGVLTQNQLVTMPSAQAPTTGAGNWYPNLTGMPGLGDFSGYYPIGSAKHPGAFVSIEGANLADPSLSSDELYRVLISVSTDGKNVRSWYYDALGGMTFDGATLRMPAQNITLSFERDYDKATGTLFNMKGKIGSRSVKSQSAFNPIPLSVFAGTMRTTNGQHELVVTPNGDVSLDGQSIPNYEYVPTMYILAGPLPGTTSNNQPVTILSLGFSGASGRTAIVTANAGTAQQEIFTVSAITNP